MNPADDHQVLPAAEGEVGISSQHPSAQSLVERSNFSDLDVTQKLNHLSALVPPPDEMDDDEATVISKTIEYVKELQQSVNLLEEHQTNFMEQEAASDQIQDTANSSHSRSYSHHHYYHVNHQIGTSSDSGDQLPDIEAKFLNKDVFVRIHCTKSKGLLIHILKHLESLHLSVTHKSALPFGSSHLEISVAAQMEDGFSLTVKELVTSLAEALAPYLQPIT